MIKKLTEEYSESYDGQSFEYGKESEIKWSEAIRKAGQQKYEDILNLAFIRELADGSLSAKSFSTYLAQDEIYIASYVELMRKVSDMLSDKSDREFMLEFAQAGAASEKAMHELLIERFSINTSVKPSEVNSAYISFLRESVEGGKVSVAMAALLPCAWIYYDVGMYIFGIAKMEGNPYREWISEYSNEAFGQTALRMVEITDRLAAEASKEEREEMNAAFLKALGFEYSFWEHAYIN